MIKWPNWIWRNTSLLPCLRNVCSSGVQSRPTWDLPSSVKWLMYAGLFTYSRNLNSSDGLWKWEESYFGIPIPTLTSFALFEGCIVGCLLASFIFFIEPLLPIRWSKQIRDGLKGPGWIIADGTLSWIAYALGVLPVISATSDWLGGELVFLLGTLHLLAMPIKTTVDVCRACKDALATSTCGLGC